MSLSDRARPFALGLLPLLLALAWVGCSGQVGESTPASPSPASPDAPAPADPAAPDPATPDPAAPAPGVASARLGIVVIDVQQLFVDGAANADMPQVLANTRAVLELAGTHQAPLLITFEDSKSAAEGRALPPEIRAAVPPHASELVKTTFAATGLPAFVDAVRAAGLTHAVVLGAETDVCVMQTVLGLRALGLSVILQTDAVFSSEPNTGPALRRMAQAGVALAPRAEVEAYVAGTRAPPDAPADAVVAVVDPPALAVVLGGLDAATVDGSRDPNKAAKLVRLEELLLIAEWFDLPLYAADPAAALPATLAGVLTTKQIRPIGELAQQTATTQKTAITQQTAITQLALAGTDKGLTELVAAHGASRRVFVVEDGLLAAADPAALASALAPLYDGGAVPITYKSLYYGLVKSVALSEWPADWVARDPIYYPKTRAPEDLPPISE